VAGQACPAIQPVHMCVVVLQPAPLAQSPSAAHDMLQAMVVALHVKVPHELDVPAVQTPAPLQLPAVVCMKLIPLPVHAAAPQDAGAAAAGQAPVPLHRVGAIDEEPSVEQDAA
jgi:hypothetical protein